MKSNKIEEKRNEKEEDKVRKWNLPEVSGVMYLCISSGLIMQQLEAWSLIKRPVAKRYIDEVSETTRSSMLPDWTNIASERSSTGQVSPGGPDDLSGDS